MQQLETPELKETFEKSIKAVFKKYDTDKSGMLDCREFKRFLNSLCRECEFEPVTREITNCIQGLLDEDGDGVVTYDELLAEATNLHNMLLKGMYHDSEDGEQHQYKTNPNFIMGLGRQIKVLEKMKNIKAANDARNINAVDDASGQEKSINQKSQKSKFQKIEDLKKINQKIEDLKKMKSLRIESQDNVVKDKSGPRYSIVNEVGAKDLVVNDCITPDNNTGFCYSLVSCKAIENSDLIYKKVSKMVKNKNSHNKKKLDNDTHDGSDYSSKNIEGDEELNVPDRQKKNVRIENFEIEINTMQKKLPVSRNKHGKKGSDCIKINCSQNSLQSNNSRFKGQDSIIEEVVTDSNSVAPKAGNNSSKAIQSKMSSYENMMLELPKTTSNTFEKNQKNKDINTSKSVNDSAKNKDYSIIRKNNATSVPEDFEGLIHSDYFRIYINTHEDSSDLKNFKKAQTNYINDIQSDYFQSLPTQVIQYQTEIAKKEQKYIYNLSKSLSIFIKQGTSHIKIRKTENSVKKFPNNQKLKDLTDKKYNKTYDGSNYKITHSDQYASPLLNYTQPTYQNTHTMYTTMNDSVYTCQTKNFSSNIVNFENRKKLNDSIQNRFQIFDRKGNCTGFGKEYKKLTTSPDNSNENLPDIHPLTNRNNKFGLTDTKYSTKKSERYTNEFLKTFNSKIQKNGKYCFGKIDESNEIHKIKNSSLGINTYGNQYNSNSGPGWAVEKNNIVMEQFDSNHKRTLTRRDNGCTTNGVIDACRGNSSQTPHIGKKAQIKNNRHCLNCTMKYQDLISPMRHVSDNSNKNYIRENIYGFCSLNKPEVKKQTQMGYHKIGY